MAKYLLIFVFLFLSVIMGSCKSSTEKAYFLSDFNKIIMESARKKAEDEEKILKYLIEECKKKSGGDFSYTPWKTEEEKTIHLLTNATLNSIKTQEEALMLGRRYQKAAEIRKNETPKHFPHNLFTSLPKVRQRNFEKLCNLDVLPKIGTYSYMFNRFTFKCFPCNCLNPKNVKCEESVALEKCVENNQWIANFTKFDNLTNNLLKVKCCKYINHTHTSKSSQDTVNKLNFVYEYCQDFFNYPSQNSFYYINNITKIDENQFTFTKFQMSCPPPEEFETTIHFDSTVAHDLNNEFYFI